MVHQGQGQGQYKDNVKKTSIQAQVQGKGHGCDFVLNKNTPWIKMAKTIWLFKEENFQCCLFNILPELMRFQ